MSEKITFIHAGDIHLGAPLRGLRALSDAWVDRLADAIPDAYDKMVQRCLDEQVDFLLLAGDVFDTDKPSYAHYRRFLKGMRKLEKAGIPVYLIAGNHDPYPNWREVIPELPSNVVMFPSDSQGFAVYERGGRPLAIIAARGFSTMAAGEDIAEGLTRDQGERLCGVRPPFCVGMLHTGLWMDPYKAPTSEEGLLASGMDYWALGHIHMRYVAPSDDPRVAFCGCVQGRDIKETGDKGCLKVVLEEGAPNKVEFISCASVQWECLRVDVSACSGMEDVVAACIRSMFDANAATSCDEMVARVVLEGRTALHGVVSDPGRLEDLRKELNESYPSFYCDALVDETSAPRDRGALASAGLFSSTLLQCFDQAKRNHQEEIAYLQDELAAVGVTLSRGMDEKIDVLLREGEERALSLLDDERSA